MSLRLEDVQIKLDKKSLFDPISCLVKDGQCLTLMGPSGAGKSSLLDYIGGGLSRDFTASGKVYVDEVSVERWPAETRRIGILYQDDLLFPHMNVAQNLSLGISAEIKGIERKLRIKQALKDANLEGFEKRDPARLSGGQRARVSCMRMLLSEPRALLLDEPFSKLDQELRERFRGFVFGRAMDLKLPMIMVTHDPADAKAANGPVIEIGA
ncbi:ATP-binding cassette domain-containing protein [Curvivirga aplysinae]|uniref:ATP-binding cassette domain-containing protein n=1 Tax=Curvivirga aplysinae TaxID=2529852 RepID=UPI0012BD6313|nr:ATP-binding cassette domain-containing protein [Curvivirga aplysinae]MTI11328.1 ATP-binding cassette domain-containing protein [Curvivirga aplysinae]